MKIKVIGSNQTEVEAVLKGKPCTVLFSYSTPVACTVEDHTFVTEQYHSPTTSRHIKAWTRTKQVSGIKPQAFFDAI